MTRSPAGRARSTATGLCAAVALLWRAAFAEPAGVAAGTAPASAMPASLVRHWHFRVRLDGRPIGEHDFTVTQRAEDTEVESHAHFKVGVLFIPLYHYDHEDHEIWRAGCLARIDAHTNDDGHESSVQGSLRNGGFEMRGPQGTAMLPACVHSFAYWDLQLLRQPRLLNPQTGVYETVALSDLGSESGDIGGGRAVSEHYTLAARAFRIDLWYSTNGQWLALQSRTGQGRRLRYDAMR